MQKTAFGLLSLLLFNISTVASADGINRSNEPIQPIPQTVQVDARKVDLGDRLFHDERLSGDNSISCAHCHALDQGGVDGTRHSFGVEGREGPINSPTVYNSGLNFVQFWDGRAATLEDQVEGPVHAGKEMDSNWQQVIKKLSADKRYPRDFKGIYKDGMTSENIKNAIAEFERSLNTPNSRFDRYLRGEDDAISDDEKTGYVLFKDYGCVACHQGANVGGNMYQTFGVMGDYFKDRGSVTKVDYGRYNVTGNEEERYLFKVPSLRMVTLTAPYFHDGSEEKLEDAIKVMAKYQLGRKIPDEDIGLMIQFLHTLAGEYNGRSLEPKR
ncbi:MAG: cytochrome-c peroxidase [Mariprofundaceae bacterium]